MPLSSANHSYIVFKYIFDGIIFSIAGPERKHRIPDEETNLITAYHEAGHTLVAYYTKDATPLHKVTIVPRGQSLGHVCYTLKKKK